MIRNQAGVGENSSRPLTEPDVAEEDSSDDDQVLEESPCGRWQKRKDEVTQKDVPGIDATYLAMDTEEGVEVVWNEMMFSERKDFRKQKSRLQKIFNNLTQLQHNNIVKFYRHWIDPDGKSGTTNATRVIFITEYMTSGSMGQFLRRTKKNNKTVNLKMWKRWCRQILYALSYLHACGDPIIHGNLTCDTIFIQHNGLIKIGSVAPDAINNHVKTYAAPRRNLHYIAPEYGERAHPGVDIYAFGVCALEMATMELFANSNGGGGGNSENHNHHSTHSHEVIMAAVEKLENPAQKEFIQLCLVPPEKRLSARQLLLHPVLFEVHPLRAFAAHAVLRLDEAVVNQYLVEKTAEQTASRTTDTCKPLAIARQGDTEVVLTLGESPSMDLEKVVEETRDGLFPLTSIPLPNPPRTRVIRPESPPSEMESTSQGLEEEKFIETRLIKTLSCQLTSPEDPAFAYHLVLSLHLSDEMNRRLSCDITNEDDPKQLATDLVRHGFISENDRERVQATIYASLVDHSN